MPVVNPPISVLTYDITVTVGGPSGDFDTLNSALSFLRTMQPVNGALAYVILKSGFILAESISISNGDLSWILISSEDPTVTVQESAIAGGYVFLGIRNSALPLISFNMTSDGGGNNTLLGVFGGSSGTFTSGVTMTNFFDVASANGAGSNIDATGLITDTTRRRVFTSLRGGDINGRNSVCTNTADITVYCAGGGVIVMDSASMTNCGNYGVLAQLGGHVTGSSMVINNYTLRGINCQSGGHVVCQSVNINGGVTNANDLAISAGGIIFSAGSVAGSASAFNTLTGAGVIYR